MNSQKRFMMAIVMAIGFGAVCCCWLSSGSAADISTEEYEISVPAMKSDTQRMVEAYERLTDQYLSLVQNQLTGMAAGNRDVLARLDRIERKLDTLSGRLDMLQQAVVPPSAPAVPAEKPAAKETPAKP
jgi:hypothetical protein